MGEEQSAAALIEALFALSPEIRYVALYRDGCLQSRQRGDAAKASSSQSDHYEELIVNPAVLTLVHQRGEIDCGGTRFVVIRYGHFFQFVMRIPRGHVSLCFEPGSMPQTYAASIEQILTAGTTGARARRTPAQVRRREAAPRGRPRPR